MKKNFPWLIILNIYLIITILLSISHFKIYTNIINPLFWFIILLLINKNSFRSYHNHYNLYFIILNIFIITIYFCTGFILGFTKSPYNHSIISIIKNTIINVLPLIGIEILRYTTINQEKRHPFIITLLLILIEINYNQILSLHLKNEQFFKYICSYFFPIISNSILYTFLTTKQIKTYYLRIINALVIILLPIFPNTDWFTNGVIGLFNPIIVYVFSKYMFPKERKIITKKEKQIENLNYVLTLIFVIILTGFMLGIFKYKPIAILSNSMSPKFNQGDILIYQKKNNLKKITKNTIIIYKLKNQYIAHRVINIKKINDQYFYQTKGDNNNTYDNNWVSEEQIEGVYAFHIKYIGFPTVWLNYYFNNKKPLVGIK